MSVEKFKKKLKIGNTTLLMNVLSQSLSLSFSLKFLEGARPGQMYLPKSRFLIRPPRSTS